MKLKEIEVVLSSNDNSQTNHSSKLTKSLEASRGRLTRISKTLQTPREGAEAGAAASVKIPRAWPPQGDRMGVIRVRPRCCCHSPLTSSSFSTLVAARQTRAVHRRAVAIMAWSLWSPGAASISSLRAQALSTAY